MEGSEVIDEIMVNMADFGFTDTPVPAAEPAVITTPSYEPTVEELNTELIGAMEPDTNSVSITPEDVAAVPVPSLDELLAAEAPAEEEPQSLSGAVKAEPSFVPTPVFTTDELAESLDIRNFATLVTLNTARWHGKVKDRKAAEMIASASGADLQAFETQKRLLAGADAKLKAVHKTIDDARTLHYHMTLPWSTMGRTDVGKRTGGRLLPHTMFQEYIVAMSKAKTAMDAALDEFDADYANAITKAQQSLGTRFDPTEYPNPASIRQHFGLSFDFHPIPVGDDFKGLADQQIAKLAHTLAKKNRVMLENAMQETWARTFELMQQAKDRFSTPDALFHYTLIDKLREAAVNLKNLNITNDPVIEKVRKTIAKHLTAHDAKDIRGDGALRKRLGEIAHACLAEMYAHAANTAP